MSPVPLQNEPSAIDAAGATGRADLHAQSPLNSTEHTPDGTVIPGILFAIPFPPPINANFSAERPSFLLWAPPRAAYSTPPKSPDGKDQKQSFTKKMEAKWQGEVAAGQAIHAGEVHGASKWERAKGAVTRKAQQVRSEATARAT